MKKIYTLALCLCTLILSSCGGSGSDVDDVTGATEQVNGDRGLAKGKMLLIYFSRAGENWQVGVVERGNTAVMADYIKELANVDVFEIKSKNEYPVSYNEMLKVATDEVDNNARPEYKDEIKNIADYETIFIGGPIWWSRPPMIFRTFFEAHPELNGKIIIPFGTSGGSGISSYTTLIREYFPKSTVLESLGINGASVRQADSKEKVKNWLNKLGIAQ